MFTFLTWDALAFTVLALVPGYIWGTVCSWIIPRRATEPQVRLVECLCLSCVNDALWFWLFGLLLATEFRRDHPFWTGCFLIPPLILSPIALGILSGRFYQRDWLRRTLARCGVRVIHQIPTAWDFHFHQAKPYWVIVTLKDGSSVHGLFGFRSFAGDDYRERDLYLEATFTLRDDGEWLPVEASAGILIKAEQISAIAFRQI